MGVSCPGTVFRPPVVYTFGTIYTLKPLGVPQRDREGVTLDPGVVIDQSPTNRWWDRDKKPNSEEGEGRTPDKEGTGEDSRYGPGKKGKRSQSRVPEGGGRPTGEGRNREVCGEYQSCPKT